MKKTLCLALATAIASSSMAAWNVIGYFNSDAYVDGWTATNHYGYVDVTWTGYASPYSPGVPGWKIKVWDNNLGWSTPLFTETWGAYSGSTNYSRRYYVTAGHSIRVELYGTGNQYPGGPNLNHCICTYLWITIP